MSPGRQLFSLLSFALVLAGLSAHTAHAQGKANRAAPQRTGVLAEDRGKFRVVLDGQVVGSEDFQISASGSEWVARGKFEANIPGAGPVQVSGRLRLGLDASPVHYEATAQATVQDEANAKVTKKGVVSVAFLEGTARMELQSEGTTPFTQEFSFNTPRVVVLDHNMYHQYAILARLYDWKARGAQSFPVLIPQAQIPGTISVEAKGPRAVEGAKLELLRIETTDLEVELYLDGLRLMRISVPSTKAEIIREK